MITYKRLYALALIPLIAGSLPGCASIEKCGFGGCASDQKITASIRSSFDAQPDLAGETEINVQTENGVVYLDESAEGTIQRDAAEAVARATPGVKRVVDTIANDP
jgi:osmotically-inducible protein OsmY